MSKNIKKEKNLKLFNKFDKVKKKRVMTELLILESLSNIRVLLTLVCDNLLTLIGSEGIKIEEIKNEKSTKFRKSSKVNSKS